MHPDDLDHPGHDELSAELLDRSSIIVDLDAAQIEGFVSGLFAAWDSDQEAHSFIDYCRSQAGPVAATLLAALAELARGDLQVAALEARNARAVDLLPSAKLFGSFRAAQAWRVRASFGESVVVGFGPVGEPIDHAVLAELDGDSALIDLALSGAPEELLHPDTLSSGMGGVAVEPCEVSSALATIESAWHQAARSGVEPTPGMVANQHLVARRLKIELGATVELLSAAENQVDVSRGMSDAEIAQANAAARSTLLAAVGHPTSTVIDAAWVEIVQARIPGLTPREREALLWLEWADWLGAGIGMIRAGVGVTVTGSALVDFVNRCPEVSSSIHADDRDYAEWAFGIALDYAEDTGLVVDGALSAAGAASLHPSLNAAWSS